MYMKLISTHSAREDGDGYPFMGCGRLREFQPTPPARTETGTREEVKEEQEISTHSAREDGDQKILTYQQPIYNFNPLRPRGRRL